MAIAIRSRYQPNTLSAYQKIAHATFWLLSLIEGNLTIIFASERGKPRHQPSIVAEQIKDLPILEGFGL